MSIKFGYFKVQLKDSRKGFVTVAIIRPEKDNPNQDHRAAFAFCSYRDTFKKKVGRAIAEGRLLANKNTIHINHTGTVSQVIGKALEEAIINKIVPSWVGRAHKRNAIKYRLTG